jgi:hypothetical protein
MSNYDCGGEWTEKIINQIAIIVVLKPFRAVSLFVSQFLFCRTVEEHRPLI